MRTHNRQIKDTFWRDPAMIRWPLAKRMLYQGLWCIADDSGCCEDDSWAIKVLLFPSPVDADITPDIISQWLDEIAEAGKIIRYEATGKKCFYMKNFHKHQRLDNPAAPEVPLPTWIQFNTFPSNTRQGKYTVSDQLETPNSSHSYIPLTDTLQTPSEPRTQNLEPISNISNSSEEEVSNEYKSADELLPPDATENEREILHELHDIPGYPLDYLTDLAFIRELVISFPSIDLLLEAKKWRIYKLDKPLEKKSNPRSQFRNWCMKAQEWNKGSPNTRSGTNSKEVKADDNNYPDNW